MFRLKANDYTTAFFVWWKKSHPANKFPPIEDYDNWMKKTYGATDNGGDYIYFKTKEEKFYFQTVFKTKKCLEDV